MSKPKIAVIGIPGKWSTEVLADAVEEKTGFRLVLDMNQLSADLNTGQLMAGEFSLNDVNGIIVKKISQIYSPNTLDRIELLRIAEQQGIRVFSKAEKIIRMIDRLSCTVTLRNGDIPMPATTVAEDVAAALAAIKEYGTAVLKPLYSTKAQGMSLISADQSKAEIIKQIEAFKNENPMMYIQKKLDLQGQDYGMVFLGGKYLGSYARVSQGETWNTTINSGGKYAAYEPDDSIIALAQKAQDLFELDFTTVDVAETDQGAIIFEVSAFGGFKGALEGAGINAADLYANYVISELEK